MARILAIIAAIACGLLVLVDFFVPDPVIDALGAILIEGVLILAAFALLLGVLNLLGVHARMDGASRSRRYSAILLVALLATLGIGVLRPASDELAWVFDYLYFPLQATMGALLAFFVVSAAYRAFKLRSLSALILLVTSLVVLITQLPFSAALSPLLPATREWIFAIPVTAGVRGILLGVSLGTIATALRVLLAVDHPYA
jgi:hypothetical membrane protein